jgi:hypothetical protein
MCENQRGLLNIAASLQLDLGELQNYICNPWLEMHTHHGSVNELLFKCTQYFRYSF